jgi:hypothetical protein
MTTQERIDELKQCPAWETHVSSLEALALQLDSDLCREREARQKAEASLNQIHSDWKEKCLEADNLRQHLKINVELRSKEKQENEKLRELLDELINGSTRMTKEIIDEYNQLTN